MADIELIEGEFGGVPYDIPIYDRNNLDPKGIPKFISFVDLGITKAFLFIAKEEDMATPDLDKKALTLLADDHTVRWIIESGDVPVAREYFSQIQLVDVDPTPTIVRFTNLLSTHVTPRTGTT